MEVATRSVKWMERQAKIAPFQSTPARRYSKSYAKKKKKFFFFRKVTNLESSLTKKSE